jgi:hypothetical protein
MKCTVEMASKRIVYIPSFMKVVVPGIQVILWLQPRERGCGAGIANGPDL